MPSVVVGDTEEGRQQQERARRRHVFSSPLRTAGRLLLLSPRSLMRAYRGGGDSPIPGRGLGRQKGFIVQWVDEGRR